MSTLPACHICHPPRSPNRAPTVEAELARVSAERDAAVKEKLAALAKVKALREALSKIQKKAAEVAGIAADIKRHDRTTVGDSTESDWIDSGARTLKAMVDAALASEVPPQPTTPATPTDKEKTR